MRSSRAAIAMLIGMACVITAGGAVAAITGGKKLAVSPAHGHERTAFSVHCTAPAASGDAVGVGIGIGQSHAYHLSATPARRRSGCIDSVAITPVASRAGQAMAVRLAPGSLGGHWCAETYSGQVTETVTPDCGPPVQESAVACPQYIALVPIGSFSFRVAR